MWTAGNVSQRVRGEAADGSQDLLVIKPSGVTYDELTPESMVVCDLDGVLIDGERSVGQLAEFLGIRDSTVSQHLALLRRDRIISGRRDGQTIWYHIESEPARNVITALYGSFCAV